MNVSDEIVKKLSESPTGAQWQKIGIKHHHGINLPLFSLHSHKSCGIGEFPDLLPLIPWCKDLGLTVIQLLPLNDSGIDASPYSAISACALNPIYLGLASLPHLEAFPQLQQVLIGLQENDQQFVDYNKVRLAKENFLEEYYACASGLIITSNGYRRFLTQHSDWLDEYALFKLLKIKNKWQSWTLWGEEYQNVDMEKYQDLLEKYQDQIAYHIFLQFLCFQQMQEVKREANKQGVFIKGDIPILISRESSDVWLHRRLFHMHLSAGAPPDMFAEEGQNWEFPIYNWEMVEKEGYAWWKLRLRVAAHLYNIYRIDHIVGFFRIWAVAPGLSGKYGHFIPEDTKTWNHHGEKIMKIMVDSCPMLPIGEDLGVVPPEVRYSLSQLGICGTRVMRWERDWNGTGNFIKPEDYQIDSMTTVSTHDSEPLQLWWTHCVQEGKDFCRSQGWIYHNELSSCQHYKILKASHQTGSLFHINLLQEYLALLPGLTWGNPQEERINIPGQILDRNWTYRFRPSVEEIVENTKLREIMKSLIQSS